MQLTKEERDYALRSSSDQINAAMWDRDIVKMQVIKYRDEIVPDNKYALRESELALEALQESLCKWEQT